MNTLLFFMIIFIWGTTWYCIKLQLGIVPPEVSIFYRFLIASLALIAWCRFKGISLRLKKEHHLLLFGLGFCLFSTNYVFCYHATEYIISGLVSVIFSTASLMNIINSKIFLKTQPEKRVLIGALLGVFGIVTIFWHEVTALQGSRQVILGITFGALCTYFFSMGNIFSSAINQRAIAVIPSTAVAMLYGTGILLFYILGQGLSLSFEPTALYISSLLYLALPGSAIGFIIYLQLIGRIGASRAGYATVFYPIVALVVSYFFENYQLSKADLIGLSLVFLGNFFVLHNSKKTKRSTSKITAPQGAKA